MLPVDVLTPPTSTGTLPEPDPVEGAGGVVAGGSVGGGLVGGGFGEVSPSVTSIVNVCVAPSLSVIVRIAMYLPTAL